MSSSSFPFSRSPCPFVSRLGIAEPRRDLAWPLERNSPRPTESEAESGQKPVKKPTPLGTDPALTVPTSRGKSLVLSYWDLWFALVAVKDCGGDFGPPRRGPEGEEELLRPSTGGRSSGSGATCVTWRDAWPVRG